MSDMQAHATVLDPEDGNRVLIHPASYASVNLVLAADPKDDNGRSPWVWVRLPNGDLILGVYPQGDTYLQCEADATHPEHR